MRIKAGAPEWEGFAEMFFYNNAMLFLPFTVSLIGGYLRSKIIKSTTGIVAQTLHRDIIKSIPKIWKTSEI